MAVPARDLTRRKRMGWKMADNKLIVATKTAHTSRCIWGMLLLFAQEKTVLIICVWWFGRMVMEWSIYLTALFTLSAGEIHRSMQLFLLDMNAKWISAAGRNSSVLWCLWVWSLCPMVPFSDTEHSRCVAGQAIRFVGKLTI